MSHLITLQEGFQGIAKLAQLIKDQNFDLSNLHLITLAKGGSHIGTGLEHFLEISPDRSYHIHYKYDEEKQDAIPKDYYSENLVELVQDLRETGEYNTPVIIVDDLIDDPRLIESLLKKFNWLINLHVFTLCQLEGREVPTYVKESAITVPDTEIKFEWKANLETMTYSNIGA